MCSRFLWGTITSIALWFQPALSLAQYAGGTGTVGDPFSISTASHMQAIGANPNDWDKFFLLTDDIDLSNFDGLGGNPAYNIIGNNPNQFTGQFDGGGFAISNLTITSTGVADIGLFGIVDMGAVIKSLVLINPTVTSDSGGVGSLVGKLHDSQILSCQIDSASVSGSIVIGGLVGECSGSTIDSCSVTGVVNGTSIVGGLVGQDVQLHPTNSTILSCYANTTLVSSGTQSGGLIGISDYSAIINCYSKGSVTGNEQVGGLIGQMVSRTKEITQCYTSCTVTGNEQVGGLIGSIDTWNAPSINTCFWDKTIGDPNFMCGVINGSCDDSAGRTTAQLQQEATFIDPVDPNNNWDFAGEVANGTDDIWRICEGLDSPKLNWEPLLPGDWACPDGVGPEDLAVLADQWLDLAPTEIDIAPNGGDGVFNLFDFQEMANYWMTGQ